MDAFVTQIDEFKKLVCEPKMARLLWQESASLFSKTSEDLPMEVVVPIVTKIAWIGIFNNFDISLEQFNQAVKIVKSAVLDWCLAYPNLRSKDFEDYFNHPELMREINEMEMKFGGYLS